MVCPVVRRHVTENQVLSRILDITRVNQAKLLSRNKNAIAWFLALAGAYRKRQRTGKSEGTRPFGRAGRRRESIIIWILKESEGKD
jgi:hypothetical protein